MMAWQHESFTSRSQAEILHVTKERNKSTLHMLHEHVAYCSSPDFLSSIYNVLVHGTGEAIVPLLDLQPDVRLAAGSCEAC